MKRFLEEHRQPLGNYDRIRFDEAHIARLRERLDLETPLRVCWTWDYVKEIESLRALYDKGKDAQWNADTYVDWSIPVTDDPPLMPLDQSPIASILKMLGRSENRDLTGTICDTLGKLGDRAAAQPLVRLLRDEEDGIVNAARGALVKLADGKDFGTNRHAWADFFGVNP